MAHVEDRWHRKARGPDGKVLLDDNGKPVIEKDPARYGKGRRWRLRYEGPDSREKNESFARKVDADARKIEVESQLQRGQWVDPNAGKVLLSAYATDWLAAQTFEESTREQMELRFRLHVFPTLGGRELRALRPSTVQAWTRGLQQQLAPNYVRTVFANLSAVLTAAADDDLIAKNPCRADSVKPPAADRRKVVPWTGERVAAVRASVPRRYAATVDMGSGLGMRQGEVFGAAVEDLDFLRGVVHVRRQVKIVGARLVFGPPKGGKERDIPLPESVALRLAAHIAAFPPVEVTLPWRSPDGKPVTAKLIFFTRERKAINRNYYNSFVWKPALEAADVIPARPNGKGPFPESREHGFHALRHRFASVLLEDGVSIRALAAYLGHEDPGFTLRTYTHLMPASEDKMRGAVDRALGGTANGPVTAQAIGE